MSRDYTEITDEQLRTINKRAIEQPSYDALREQNRVLASHLNNLVEWALEVTKDWTVDDDSTLANDLRMIWQAQAALTATSQEGQHG